MTELSFIAFCLNPYVLISFFVWLTYSYTLKCGAVSDDHAGLLDYDGKLQGWEYGMLWRWVRYHIVGGNFPSNKKLPDGTAIPQGKDMPRHHFLSIVVFNITCLVAYQALFPILGSKIALLAILILIVHPCTTQGVAWVSGLAYPLSLLWISLTIILMQWFYANPSPEHALIALPVFCLIQFFAIHAIFATTVMIWSILLFLGYWHFAIFGFVVSGAMCFDIIRQTVKFRVDEFKKQHMAQSTLVNWGKPVVMMKTLFYYVCHAIAPRKMGLYHEFGFHYEKDLERRNWMFWLGALCLVGISYLFLHSNSLPLRFGLLWWVVFSVGFWNLITAQQFITERYILVANLGLGIVIATLTMDYLWIYTFILGAYLCRTWMHLPTYDDEIRFYQSNVWNFPKSEVALGNLGVTFLKAGASGMAMDIWSRATQINKEYDVPWVNMFYNYRSQAVQALQSGNYAGSFQAYQLGLPYLENAIKCKVCHFPEMWGKERDSTIAVLRDPSILFEDEMKRLLVNRENYKNLMMKATTDARAREVQESTSNNDKQIDTLCEFMRSQKMTFKNSAVAQKINMDNLMSKLGG